MDNKLTFEVIKNPSIGQLKEQDELKMHQFTLLAYKMKQGVQMSQKYGNVVYELTHNEKQDRDIIAPKEDKMKNNKSMIEQEKKDQYAYVKYLS